MKKITGKVLALSLSGAMLASVAALTGCGDGNSNAENTETNLIERYKHA